jgi:hypothetical protein
MMLTDASLISAERPSPRGRVSTELAFQPGPVDWPEGKTLDFGVADGFGLKVLRFVRQATERVEWVADPSGREGAALQLELRGPGGRVAGEGWLTATYFGGEAVIGPTRYELLPVPVKSMVQDFLEPPTEDPGKAGILSIHHGGKLRRVRVDEQLGKKIALDDSGLAVEVIAYLANAKPTHDMKFISTGEQPKNPVLELKVHLPKHDRPARQLAFAKAPLLTLDAVRGNELPIKFWYHHPAVKPVSGAVFLQTPEGTLYCRAVTGGAGKPPQAVKPGDKIPLGAEFSVLVRRHLPQARKQVSFQPVDPAVPGEAASEAAALVEVTVGKEQRQVWLKRQDAAGAQRVDTAQGPVQLTFGYDERPLGVALKLNAFIRQTNPGRAGDAAYASRVAVVNTAGAVQSTHTISMNEPLVEGQYTFYQSSFQEIPGGGESSVLTVAYDPGRTLKYCGSLMIVSGSLTMFTTRSYFFKSLPRLGSLYRRKGPSPALQTSQNPPARAA